MRIVEFQIQQDPPARLDKALARDVPVDASLSRSRLARMIAAGEVQVNGAVVTDPRARLTVGDQIKLIVNVAAVDHLLPEALALDIVFEDEDIIVVNKPAGMVVHPAPGSPNGTLVNALMHHCGASLSGVGGEMRPGIVHRIDKETSGLLVVAKSDRAHHGLAAQFEAHRVERHYRALCYGVPDSNDPRLRGVRGASFETGNILRLQTELARHKHDRQKQQVVWHNGRHAVTRARIVARFGSPPALSLLDCWLETGRTHQIRVHLAYAGHGLVGDPIYGGRRKVSEKAVNAAGLEALRSFSRQALHAATLGFEHPVNGEMMRFEAALPPDMSDLIGALGGAEEQIFGGSERDHR